jgi:hypothetical protein
MLCGVIGNTPDFGSGILGSSPNKAVRKKTLFLQHNTTVESEVLRPCDGTGIRTGLRNQVLWVFPSGTLTRTTPTKGIGICQIQSQIIMTIFIVL